MWAPSVARCRFTYETEQPSPDGIGSSLTSLNTLHLYINDLHGPIPESLCLIGHSLVRLNLAINSLTGEYVRRVVCGVPGGGGEACLCLCFLCILD